MTDTYRSWSIKRDRRTKAEMHDLRQAITDTLANDHPMTVRQVFYRLVVAELIEKTELAYHCVVIRLLSEMRLSGDIPWSWITDESRRTHQTETFDSVADALANTKKYYRRSALREADVYIEIWSEKEALSGIIWDEASDYDVPVVVSKGVPSLTQVYTSFENILAAAEAGKASFVYQFGDHDPTGCMIPQSIDKRLNEFCQQHNIDPPVVERIALTPEQITTFRLPSRPTKRNGNTHAKTFKGRSTELDALPPKELRKLVRRCITRHIKPRDVAALRVTEDSERQLFDIFAKRAARAAQS